MSDTRLGDSMRALPRVKASPAFTSEVLRRVRLEPEAAAVRRMPWGWRMAAVVAMAACLVAAVQLATFNYAHRQHVAALRAEQQELEAELEAVKKIAREAEPLVVLENDRGTRVVMDLDSAVQPASLRTWD